MPRAWGSYRGNLTVTWDKVLSAAFPVIRQLVGEEFFGALSRFRHGPSVGQSGPEPVRRSLCRLPHRFEHVADLPYLPDMARLEWCLHRTHYAAEAPAIDAAQLACLSPEELESSRYALHPCASLFASSWAVVPLWQAHQAPDAAFPPEMAAPCQAVIARPQWKTELRPLAAAEFAALSALAQGETMGAALDAAFERDEQMDVAAYFKQWIELGLLAAN
ncbi:DNA-binding domain-containing protein [Massilia sp. B-10]|nr:DNA-binding domain-containing protein [Massilia sp. B-10]